MPISSLFSDVYFSHLDKLAETRYVFLPGNQLLARWTYYPKSLFTVAETDFGIGLNFLLLWQIFYTVKQRHPQAQLKRLHYISLEQYLLNKKDLIVTHQC